MLRRLERGTPLNATHCFWIELVSKMRCPFIKRELLIYNPFGVPHVCGWRDVIRSVSSYDTEAGGAAHTNMSARPGHIGNPSSDLPSKRRMVTCARAVP